MPLSNRRRARRKEIQLQETSDVEAPDSSPTRPTTKRRKVRIAVSVAWSSILVANSLPPRSILVSLPPLDR